MKILLTGSQGYVGSGFIERVQKERIKIEISGLDSGFFQGLSHYSLGTSDFYLKSIHFKDLRDVRAAELNDYDAIIHLAAISNDPIGDKFEDLTYEINFQATINLAKQAKLAGVKKFIFASSASVYGYSDDICVENSKLDPLTAYAKSKVYSENELETLSGSNFQVTCLRFATAAGWSPRLRSDIALNNFVINALIHGKITLNSKGNANRPFVDVHDMAEALLFCLSKKRDSRRDFEIYNVGQNSWNFKIIELAELVATKISGTKIETQSNASDDTRSYMVNFDKYVKDAEEFQLKKNIEETINILANQVQLIINEKTTNFFSRVIRLKSLESQLETKILTDKMRFN